MVLANHLDPAQQRAQRGHRCEHRQQPVRLGPTQPVVEQHRQEHHGHRVLVQHDAQQQRLDALGMAMRVAVMGVRSALAAKRHALEEGVETQSYHQPNRQSAVPMRMRMTMLDSAREVLEHDLNKKTNQNKRAEIRPPVIAGEHFRQQVQRRDREQVGAAEGDQ